MVLMEYDKNKQTNSTAIASFCGSDKVSISFVSLYFTFTMLMEQDNRLRAREECVYQD